MLILYPWTLGIHVYGYVTPVINFNCRNTNTPVHRFFFFFLPLPVLLDFFVLVLPLFVDFVALLLLLEPPVEEALRILLDVGGDDDELELPTDVDEEVAPKTASVKEARATCDAVDDLM